MVSVDHELPALQHEPKVPDGGKGGQELVVKGGVILLSRGQLLEKEARG